MAQGPEERWIELGYTRNLVVEDSCAGGDSTVSLAKCTTILTGKTTVLTAEDFDG